jgi:hypothetical protein
LKGRQESGERRKEKGDRRKETGDRRQETGDRRRETGDRRQDDQPAWPKAREKARYVERQLLTPY